MARIEDFTSPELADMASPTVSEIPTSVGADASPKGGICRAFLPTQPETCPAMSDEDREQAICRASELVEYLHSLYRFHEAIWRRDGCFHHKAGFDLAYSDCHAARGIMERLIKGRSPAYVAFLERQRGLDLPACANEERGLS